MNAQTDQQLLRAYAGSHSEPAFAELVRRHVDLVYSAAQRMVGDSHQAEDVAQGVFVALAQNARQLTQHPVLSGWLHRTTQNLAANAVRTNVRRQTREQESVAMNELLAAEPDANWEHIAPHLDAALGDLSEPDRDALLLRYFERKSAREMAQTLGISDEAAQRRVSRAIERLREFFTKRGVTVGASGLVVVVSANSVQAAPVGLAVTISTAATLAGTTHAVTATATTIKTIAMTTLQKTLITATLAAAIGTGIYEARQASQLRNQVQTFQQQQEPLTQQNRQLQNERDDAMKRLASMAEEMASIKGNNEELLKLRGKVGVLQGQVSESSQRVHIAEQKLAEASSAQAQFEADQGARNSAVKQLALAMFSFSLDHDSQFPTNLDQSKKELEGTLDPIEKELGGVFTIGGINLSSFEFKNIGGGTLAPPNLVLLRERLARQAPDGTWRRTYCFTDGSVHTAIANDGNFEAWEKANTYLQPRNRNR